MTPSSNRPVIILLLMVLILQILGWVFTRGETDSDSPNSPPLPATRADVAHFLEVIETRPPDLLQNHGPVPERVDADDATEDLAEIQALFDDFRQQLSTELADFMRALEAFASGDEDAAASHSPGSTFNNFRATNDSVATHNQLAIRPTPPSKLVRIPVGATVTIYDEEFEKIEPQPGTAWMEDVGRDHEVIHLVMSTGSFPVRGKLVISSVITDGSARPNATFETVPR